jgi:chemotaxis protein CheC
MVNVKPGPKARETLRQLIIGQSHAVKIIEMKPYMRKNMNTASENSNELQELMYRLAIEGVRNSIKSLSQTAGTELTITEPEVKLVPVLEIPNLLGGPETEAIGVILLAEGGSAGQFMLIFPYKKALELVDLLMFEPLGTTTELGSMERSALAEAGNMTCAFFLNKIAEITKLETLPSPPEVVADMVGAILNILVSTTAEYTDQVMLIRTEIMQGDLSIQANFWFIPNPLTVESFAEQALKNIE